MNMGADPLLLQITATLAEIKTSQGSHAERTERALEGIAVDIRNFGERLISLEKDNEIMKEDITKRTHREETLRIKNDIKELETVVGSKVNLGFAKIVVSILVFQFTAVIGAAIKIAFFP